MTDAPTNPITPPVSAPTPPPLPNDHSRGPRERAGGPSQMLVGGLALALVLVLGVGALSALGIAPFARPTPSATATAQPTSTPPFTSSPARTTSPASTPTAPASTPPTPGVTATPIASGDVVALLLSHIPSDIVGSCTTMTGEGKILARSKCSADDGKILVTYSLYGDFDSMFATYEGFREASQIEPNTGNCNNPASWPAESDFAISGQPSGRFLCTEALGATTIYWTDNRLNILSQATDIESDYARLVDFWEHESGPNL